MLTYAAYWNGYRFKHTERLVRHSLILRTDIAAWGRRRSQNCRSKSRIMHTIDTAGSRLPWLTAHNVSLSSQHLIVAWIAHVSRCESRTSCDVLSSVLCYYTGSCICVLTFAQWSPSVPRPLMYKWTRTWICSECLLLWKGGSMFRDWWHIEPPSVTDHLQSYSWDLGKHVRYLEWYAIYDDIPWGINQRTRISIVDDEVIINSVWDQEYIKGVEQPEGNRTGPDW